MDTKKTIVELGIETPKVSFHIIEPVSAEQEQASAAGDVVWALVIELGNGDAFAFTGLSSQIMELQKAMICGNPPDSTQIVLLEVMADLERSPQ